MPLKEQKLSLIRNIGQKGQTAVEYIIMVAVVTMIIITLMKKVRAYLLSDTEGCTPTSTQVICAWERMFDSTNNFRTFQIRR